MGVIDDKYHQDSVHKNCYLDFKPPRMDEAKRPEHANIEVVRPRTLKNKTPCLMPHILKVMFKQGGVFTFPNSSEGFLW